MKKHFHLIFLVLSIFLLVGCENKTDNTEKSNKEQSTQIKENDSVLENTEKDDNNKKEPEKNANESSSKEDNSKNKEETKNNNNNKVDNTPSIDKNNSTSTNNNTNSNNKDNINTESNKLPKEAEPTIEYTCYEEKDIYKNGTCYSQYTYVGTLNHTNPYTCPTGHVYKQEKCYISKEPNIIKYCDNKDYTLEGELCLSGAPYNANKTSKYYKKNENSVAQDGVSYSLIDTEDYTGQPTIECYSNHTKKIDAETKTSYCQNDKGEKVSPISVRCDIGLDLINNENVYQCKGTKYNYYYCKGKLVGTTCYPGKLVNYGMYCDDESEIENGKCNYVTNIKPTANYSCHEGDKKIDEEKQMCIHKYTTEPKKVYKCPNGYFLGTDQKCYIQ